jgi:hypothetical protein
VYPKSSGQSHHQVTRSSSGAREELLAWAKAGYLRDRAAKYMNDARDASDSSAQRRLNNIAQHYRLAAAAEAKDAGRLGNERREKSKISENGTFDGRPEIETLRLKLRQFASQQTDQIVRSRCLALDQKLAENLRRKCLNLVKYWQITFNALNRPFGARLRSVHPQSNESPVSQECSPEEDALNASAADAP